MSHVSLLAVAAMIALLLGGCASKKAGDAAMSTPTATEAVTGGKTSSSTGAGVQSEEVPAPVGATLSTLGGTQLDVIYFDYDSFTLQPTARQSLERNATWLQANPAVRVTIEGHCDERGSDEYNLALGDRRARSVKTYLVMLGVAGERLTTVSYGEERPVVTGLDERAWAQNRRAELK